MFWSIAEEFAIDAVVLERPVPRRTFLKNRLRRLGPSAVAGQLAFQLGVVPVLRRTSAKRVEAIRRDFRLRSEPIPPHLVTPVDSANGDATLSVLRELRPKVIVVCGTRILSKRLLSSVAAPFVNMHAGITPSFRGVHGGYWALAENQPERCGVTVHLVDPGVDTGQVLAQAVISPGPDDNFVTYPLLQLAAGLPLLKLALRELLGGKRLDPIASVGPSRQWFHPTIWSYVATRVFRGVK